GDGLVSQIPSLIVSTAAGLVVTRAGSGGELAGQFTDQFSPHPRAFGLAGAFLALAGAIPGMPTLPLFVLAALCGAGAYMGKEHLKKKVSDEIRAAEEVPEEEAPEEIESFLAVDVLELEVGYELIHLVDTEQGGDLLDRIKSLRRRFAAEMGFIVPQIHIRDNLQLAPAAYRIKIKGSEVAAAELRPAFLMAMDPGGTTRRIKGVPTKEPAFGLPALWISEGQKEEAEAAGYTVVDLSTVVATHLAEIIKRHCHELLTRQDVQRLMDNLAKTYPKTVEELVPETLSLGTVQKVLQNLLREAVSIRDMLTIVETLSDRGETIKDPEYLTEYVRAALARAISAQHVDSSGSIGLFTLDGHVEQALRDAIEPTEQGAFLNLSPTVRQSILTALAQTIERNLSGEASPVVLCSPTVRAHFKRMTERFLPNLVVISHNEIDGLARVRSLGTVRLEHAS
ncbi:MAG: FHIPEP family type III secretion protein, partial [Myxococcales bacterium]|nr:FHIPEP family type III secretion protein [Myxococcales bacterium]